MERLPMVLMSTERAMVLMSTERATVTMEMERPAMGAALEEVGRVVKQKRHGQLTMKR